RCVATGPFGVGPRVVGGGALFGVQASERDVAGVDGGEVLVHVYDDAYPPSPQQWDGLGELAQDDALHDDQVGVFGYFVEVDEPVVVGGVEVPAEGAVVVVGGDDGDVVSLGFKNLGDPN